MHMLTKSGETMQMEAIIWPTLWMWEGVELVIRNGEQVH